MYESWILLCPRIFLCYVARKRLYHHDHHDHHDHHHHHHHHHYCCCCCYYYYYITIIIIIIIFIIVIILIIIVIVITTATMIMIIIITIIILSLWTQSHFTITQGSNMGRDVCPGLLRMTTPRNRTPGPLIKMTGSDVFLRSPCPLVVFYVSNM